MIFYLFLVGCFANIAIASPINIEKQGLLKGYTNSTDPPSYDFLNVDIINTGSSEVTTKMSLYLDENTDLVFFDASKDSKHFGKPTRKSTLKPINFTGGIYNAENEVAMSKMNLKQEEKGSYGFAYESFGGSATKRTNKFFMELQLEQPDSAEVVFSSANFDAANYPPNSRHSYLFRCDESHVFNLEMTNFDVEEDMDSLKLYSISSGQSETVVSEIRSVGPVKTKTNQLLVEFRSDCDGSIGGFRGILTAVALEEHQTTLKNASDILEAITRDVLSSDIWEKYNNTLYFDSYEYRYDHPYNYLIADGGKDMYDNGNKVSFSVSNGSFTYSENKTIYGEAYSNNDIDVAYTSIKRHPFMSLLWVGDANRYGSFLNATITVNSNTGADGGGSFSASEPQQLYSGESTLHTANFQVYNATQLEPNDDPSICEVYAVIGREKWNSYIEGNPTFSYEPETHYLENTFKITGKNFLVVYFLLSDANQEQIDREAINDFLSTVYEFGSSVEV